MRRRASAESPRAEDLVDDDLPLFGLPIAGERGAQEISDGEIVRVGGAEGGQEIDHFLVFACAKVAIGEQHSGFGVRSDQHAWTGLEFADGYEYWADL